MAVYWEHSWEQTDNELGYGSSAFMVSMAELSHTQADIDAHRTRFAYEVTCLWVSHPFQVNIDSGSYITINGTSVAVGSSGWFSGRTTLASGTVSIPHTYNETTGKYEATVSANIHYKTWSGQVAWSSWNDWSHASTALTPIEPPAPSYPQTKFRFNAAWSIMNMIQDSGKSSYHAEKA